MLEMSSEHHRKMVYSQKGRNGKWIKLLYPISHKHHRFYPQFRISSNLYWLFIVMLSKEN